MNIAITGATGFIGRHVVNSFLEKGHSVSLLSRGYKETKQEGRILYVKGELSDSSSLKKLLKNADVICNCAGEYNNNEAMYEVNYTGVKNLYLVANELEVNKFIQLSSVGVYGYHANGCIDETVSYNAENEYEASKIKADQWLLSLLDKRPETYILRPSIVFGEDMKNDSLRELVSAITEKKFFFIGRPGSSANYIYVKNVADAIVTIAESGLRPEKKVYNLSDYTTMEEFVSIILNHYGIRSSILRLPYSLVYLIAHLMDLANKTMGIRFPLTRARVRALTSHAQYDSTLFKKTFEYEYPVDIETGLIKSLFAWSE